MKKRIFLIIATLCCIIPWNVLAYFARYIVPLNQTKIYAIQFIPIFIGCIFFGKQYKFYTDTQKNIFGITISFGIINFFVFLWAKDSIFGNHIYRGFNEIGIEKIIGEPLYHLSALLLQIFAFILGIISYIRLLEKNDKCS